MCNTIVHFKLLAEDKCLESWDTQLYVCLPQNVYFLPSLDCKQERTLEVLIEF